MQNFRTAVAQMNASPRFQTLVHGRTVSKRFNMLSEAFVQAQNADR